MSSRTTDSDSIDVPLREWILWQLHVTVHRPALACAVYAARLFSRGASLATCVRARDGTKLTHERERVDWQGGRRLYSRPYMNQSERNPDN